MLITALKRKPQRKLHNQTLSTNDDFSAMKTQMTNLTTAMCSLHSVVAHAPRALPGGYQQPSLPSTPKCSVLAVASIGNSIQGWFNSNNRLT
ncbi:MULTISPECIES: hypothetical protein [unclassified Variovorax]|uniref:hypothetical protein n=1 Tax=unclassified Variovorax TaxID=663243 RepID=UPI000B1D8019|nr:MULTISPECIES: hypothetical protein [unclassified Variovorax]PNG50079.1 hypothetical protein CHC06_05702 [Variovorax sp. B2]PNG50951.1 hypothetical protein CHC07_05607 [Variovorax sp. B4]VTU41720.1 hypothetical protein SRS16P1_00116 [Variovorax sp. SRS16]VTU41759.1 hypothetical protein E5P1_00116 [Variovorax sp. PBL-E5]VTU44673.1 hypothetical protein H6P1_00818 [Variovorax sp. PBL-H6]